MSLKRWDEIGIIQRELAPYNHIAEYFKKVYIYSYGKDDNQFKRYLKDNIVIIQNKNQIPSKMYSVILPFILKKRLKECSILKTNQIQGSISAVLTKILFKKKLIVRSGYIASLMAKQNKTPILKRAIIFIEEYLAYKFADDIIITSKRNKEYIIRKYPFTRKKINVIENMIDTSIFKPIKIKKKKKLVGYVGRLDQRQKNLFSLIEAVIGTDVRLVFAGQGPEKQRLVSLAKNNNVDLRIIDRIENYELPKFLNSLDLFVLPSLYEGNPKALLEAMSCGCAVIACDVFGVNDIIKDKENGLLCEPTESSLKKTMVYLIDNDELKNKISLKARKTIKEKYDLNKLINKELMIYERLSK